MIRTSELPVEEGDKIEIENKNGVYVVSKIIVSVTMQPVGGNWTDEESYDKEDIVEMHESGELRVLNDNEATTEAAREVAELVDIDELTDALEGRKGLRTTKPDANGLTQYVWRMARFHGGHDTCMPVMAHSWLQGWVDEQDIDASVTGILDEEGKEIRRVLEQATDAVLARLGENPAAGAKRWGQTGIFG